MSFDIIPIINFFKSTWNNEVPLFYYSHNGRFLYDSGTNKILEFDEHESSMIDNFFDLGPRHFLTELTSNPSQYLDTALFIQSAILEHGILSAIPSRITMNANEPKMTSEQLLNDIDFILLEVTEHCNLRCKYCVYSDVNTHSRAHGSGIMSKKTANHAIDILLTGKNTHKRIAFYGGEPLLNFSLMQHCVDYASNKAALYNKHVSYSFTTNGLLLSEERIQYLKYNNFAIMFSIDGIRSTHDSHRLDANQNGTYDNVLNNLKLACQIYGELAKEKISINMTFAKPHTKERALGFLQFFKENDFAGGLYTRIDYANEPNNNTGDHDDLDSLADFILEHTRPSAKHTNNDKQNSIKNFVEFEMFKKLIQMPITKCAIKKFPLNGCCKPGLQRLFISTNGDMSLCERVHNDTPRLGNVFTGFDVNIINSFFNDQYIAEFGSTCSHCWAVRLCSICYVHSCSNGSYDRAKRSSICKSVRAERSHQLENYVNALRFDETIFDHIVDKLNAEIG